MKTPGKLLQDLKWSVALRGAYIVYVVVVSGLSPRSWGLLLRGLLIGGPLSLYALYGLVMSGFRGWKTGVFRVVLPVALGVGVLWWSRWLGSGWLAGLSLFAVFAGWRAYNNWETLVNAKRYARMIRKQGNTDELLEQVEEYQDSERGV